MPRTTPWSLFGVAVTFALLAGLECRSRDAQRDALLGEMALVTQWMEVALAEPLEEPEAARIRSTRLP